MLKRLLIINIHGLQSEISSISAGNDVDWLIDRCRLHREKLIVDSPEKCVFSIIKIWRNCVVCLRFLWRKHGKSSYQNG